MTAELNPATRETLERERVKFTGLVREVQMRAETLQNHLKEARRDESSMRTALESIETLLGVRE